MIPASRSRRWAMNARTWRAGSLIAALAAGVGAKPVTRRPGRRLQRLCRRRVVAVGVGDEDVRHLLVGERGDERGDVLFELEAGIDDRDLTLADDIGAGALIGKGPGVLRDDAADPRRDRFEP